MLAWIIDRDHGGWGCVGYGRRVNGVNIARVYGSMRDPVKFVLKDDDGETYFSGRMRRDWAEGVDETRLTDPLMFGARVAGTTQLWIDGELVVG